MRTATIRRLATSVAAAISDVSRSDTAVTADSTPPSGGDPPCAFAMIDAKANEEAPYFTNRRRDSFWSATNGLPQLRDMPGLHFRFNLTDAPAVPSLGQ